MIWLIECPWEMEHSPVLSLSALYLSPFSEWCELQKEAKFHRDSCKDIPDAVNSFISDRPLNIYSFQEISSPHEHAVIDHFLWVQRSKKLLHTKLGGCQETNADGQFIRPFGNGCL